MDIDELLAKHPTYFEGIGVDIADVGHVTVSDLRYDIHGNIVIRGHVDEPEIIEQMAAGRIDDFSIDDTPQLVIRPKPKALPARQQCESHMHADRIPDVANRYPEFRCRFEAADPTSEHRHYAWIEGTYRSW